ncbi:DUF2461 domain-containing protein [Dyadobacter arcticus]|uniref:Uncharacterized protein (TIGR02453 family) n=1 Tax=Dyadobacter arcticus TaxID=1078754 RepID=A0ABX0US38_9BACT|nr:DUF2461 domain-containing protein [Dyadobacter arcticus]NIJ54729.1 uncharacterized protein (TIGR02453 family) [Dyadobacter arcticus]
MIQAATLKFLEDLKKNNVKEWFDDNRKAYELARANFLDFSQKLIDGISAFDQDIAVANLVAKNCMSRINRDIRFSKDKSPYKTNFFLIVNAGGKKGNHAGYYFQLEPGASFVGGGAYMPMPEDLQKFRQEIEYNFTEWQKLVSAGPFLKTYANGIQSPETLSRAPKGFEENSPAIEYLKMKGYYAVTNLSDQALVSEKSLADITSSLETVQPLVAFLNHAFV